MKTPFQATSFPSLATDTFSDIDDSDVDDEAKTKLLKVQKTMAIL